MADARGARVPMQTDMGLAVPVPYPPAPIVIEAHPRHFVLSRVESAPFFFASPLTFEPRFAERGSVLAESSERESWLLRGDPVDVAPRSPHDWQPGPEPGPFALTVALEGRLPSAFGDEAAGERPARVLVSGSGQDTYLPDPGPGGEPTGALSVATRAVEWLVEDDALLALAPGGA